jgi:hypothetical protein
MGLGDTNLSEIPRWYRKNLADSPAKASVVQGAGLGALGYAGAGIAAPMIVKLMTHAMRMDPATRASVMKNFKGDSLKRIQMATAAIMGLTGAAYPLMTRSDGRPGKKLNSIFSGDHWDKNPERANQLYNQSIQDDANEDWDMDVPFQRGVEKTGAFGDWDSPFLKEKIPVAAVQQYLSNDAYLSGGQKGMMHTIVDDASNGKRSGLISGKDLARGAVRVGVGYGAAFALGQTVGKIFDLPEPLTSRMSRIGGIAGAIINTGVFGQ